MKAVGFAQASISNRPLHELVAEPGAPFRSKCGRLRQSLDVKAASVVAADFHREGIVEAQRWPQSQPETSLVLALHPLINVLLMVISFLFDYFGEGGAA